MKAPHALHLNFNMKKYYLPIATWMVLMNLNAQNVDIVDSRWLKSNPASPQRAERLLEVERKQILETGTYDIEPFDEPRLEQIAPSLQHLQYFYEGQRELFEYNNMPEKKKSDLRALRARYERLYDMNEPAYQAEAEYYLGYIDYLEGKYESALLHFKCLPSDSKYSYTVPFYEMQIGFLKGNYNEALNTCIKMEEQRYRYTAEQMTEVARIKAECLLEKGYKEDALAQFRIYAEQCGNPLPTSAYNAAVLEYGQQRYTQAAHLASVATKSNKLLLRQYAYMLIGKVKLAENKISEARMSFEQASHGADKNINEAAAYNVCAIAHESNRSVWGDEIHILEDFINNYTASQFADRVSTFLSEAYTTTRNYEAALNSINKIRQPNSQLLKAKQRLLFQLGIQHYVNGEYKKALNRLNECVRMGNMDTETRNIAWFWRGEARYHLQDFAGATDDYKNFISARNQEQTKELLAAAYYNLGYAHLKQQQYAEAISAFGNYILLPEEKGTDAYNDGMVRLADCHYYTRQFAPAEEYYHAVAEQAGIQSDYALYQEALMKGLQKKYTDKQSVLDNLITRYPNSEFVDDAWLDKGRTALLMSDNATAIQSFRQVVDNYADSPIAPQAAIQLAMTYNNMGKAEEAQRIYELVAERYPDTDAAATAAEDLKVLSIQQRIASLPVLYQQGNYQELLDTYQQLVQQNLDFRDRQNLQLLAGKAHLALQETDKATVYFNTASQDMRTASGAEAKFLLAQMAFDQHDNEQAQLVASELMQSGTPHQYWLARAIILISDVFAQQGETFTATEYLKSLKQNYTRTDDDIQSLVDARLQVLDTNSETESETSETENMTTETETEK